MGKIGTDLFSLEDVSQAAAMMMVYKMITDQFAACLMLLSVQYTGEYEIERDCEPADH